MSLSEGFPWEYKEWRFRGYSLAGITTSIVCQNASVCFDVGQGLPFQIPAKRIFITHPHMDHASGLPYLLAQKSMVGLKDTRVFVPLSFLEPIKEILRLWQRVDEHEFSFRVEGVAPGTLHELDPLLAFKAFPTVHRVPSQGYILFEKKKRLKEEFSGLSQREILAAKNEGQNPNEEWWEPRVAFTGDTQIEFTESAEEALRAKILFVEVTFWDDKKSVEHARRWGHLHFDELLVNLHKFKNERIVLIHSSIRYSKGYLEKILRERLPESEQARVVLFPRP